MIRKGIFICLLFLCSTFYLFAQDTNAVQLTLEQCIQIALKNNADVQHRQVTSEIAKANWQGTKGYLIPTLSGDITHGLSQGRSIDPYTNAYANQNINFADYTLSSSVTLFNAFAIQNNIKQSRLAFDASKMEVQQMKDAIALNVILEYLQVLTNQDLVNISIQQKDVSAKQVERLEILNSEGAIAPSQLYDLKGEYADNELSVVNATNNLETAKVLLAQFLNMPYNKNMQFAQVGLSENLATISSNADSIYQSALNNLAIIKASELRRQSAVYGVRTYRSLRFPSLYVSGNLYTNYSSNASTQQLISSADVETTNYVIVNGDKIPVYARQDNYAANKINYGSQFRNNFSSSLSIGIRIPLLNNFQNRTQIKTALLQQKDAEITLNTNKVQLQQNIEQAYVNLTAAQNRYDVLTEQVNAYRESFREAEVKFNTGVINSVDYLVAKNNLDRSNINLIIARYNYVLSSMILDYYSGKLVF